MVLCDSARQNVVLGQKFLVQGASELKRVEPWLIKERMESRTKLSTLASKVHFLDAFDSLSLEPIRVCIFLLEYLSLPYSHFVQDDLQSLGTNNPALVYISI